MKSALELRLLGVCAKIGLEPSNVFRLGSTLAGHFGNDLRTQYREDPDDALEAVVFRASQRWNLSYAKLEELGKQSLQPVEPTPSQPAYEPPVYDPNRTLETAIRQSDVWEQSRRPVLPVTPKRRVSPFADYDPKRTLEQSIALHEAWEKS
jgi:hypothetical protein